MSAPLRSAIPFDSVTLSAVTEELQGSVGGKIQGVRQPDESTILIAVYANGVENWILLSCNAMFARAHYATRRRANLPNLPAFCAALRSRLDGGQLVAVRQVANDRVLELAIESAKGNYRIIAELMGKHSNLMLVDENGRVVSAMKWVGRQQSVRPIQPNVEYQRPPVLPEHPPKRPESPFFRSLVSAGGDVTKVHSVLVVGKGAYPYSVASLGYEEVSRASISVALEQHFDHAIPQHEVDTVRQSLLAQLSRVTLAREVAIQDLQSALDAGLKAGALQRKAELILAYGPTASPGATTLNAWDYDGSEVLIKLDPTLSYKDNANRFFDRAKRAKARMGEVGDQLARLQKDRSSIQAMCERIQLAQRVDEITELQAEARSRRWLAVQAASARKEDRPYEGHRIRELIGPGGITVLYGENAEANDYLTVKVAKPNDYWLHIRGATSAHVVILTQNQPDRVGREHLEFAAKVAVQHSPSKHSGYVAVDYTLKKYVRRPRGAAKGTALYTHEKTLHVE